MITEIQKDLVDRREFYQMMVKRMNQHGNATLNSTLTLREIVEIFNELPTQEEISAEWIKEEDNWVCSWCRMKSYAPITTRYCSYCGRRMKVRTFDGNKSR